MQRSESFSFLYVQQQREDIHISYLGKGPLNQVNPEGIKLSEFHIHRSWGICSLFLIKQYLDVSFCSRSASLYFCSSFAIYAFSPTLSNFHSVRLVTTKT